MLASSSILARFAKRLFLKSGQTRRRSLPINGARRVLHRAYPAAELLEERALLCASSSAVGGLASILANAGNNPWGNLSDVKDLPPGLQQHVAETGRHDEHGTPPLQVDDQTGADSAALLSAPVPSGAATFPLGSVPPLNSLIGAPATLFLDFDSHVEPNWNGYTNVTIPAYDFDGDSLSFSQAELDNIAAIWFRVAEDFAPFNINVTTVEPAVLAAGVPAVQANGLALRVAIGGTDFTGNGYGGIASINSFTSSTANVVFSFSQGSSTPSVANIVSHEAGHGFGLYHQSTWDAWGNKLLEYNTGDFLTWTPIMGTSMWSSIVQTWYNGTNSQGATVYQDDMAVIAGATNGFGYRPDDVGNTTASATPLTSAGATWSGAGLVGTNTDIDMFSFVVTTEDTYRITVKGLAGLNGDVYASNLDAAVELRNSAGVLLGSASPADMHDAELRKGLTPGTYYVGVKSSGTYGWVGQYTVGIDAPPAGISVVPAAGTLTTGEEGRVTSFSVALLTQPTANVVIPVSSTNPSEGTVSTSTLTFTPANWDIPQIVTVTGVGDGVVDSDVPYSIVLGAAASADGDYNGIDLADLSALNLDNDAAGFLYYIDWGTDTIRRTRLNGSQSEVLVDLNALFGANGSYSPQTLTIDRTHGKLYWTDSSATRIQRANLDGSGVETVVSVNMGSGAIAVDEGAGKLYWVNGPLGKIQRSNLDGTGIEDVVTGQSTGVRGLTLDPSGGKLYWTDGTARTVSRANLNGTGVEVLWTGVAPSRPVAIALDPTAGKIYWSDPDQNRILRAGLDGSNVETVVDGTSYTTDFNSIGLTVDSAAGLLYWTDNTTHGVYRASLDGSNRGELATGSRPRGIAVAHLAPDISVTHRTGVVTSEDGVSDVFRVVLTTKPTANVTINLTNGDLTEGTLSTTSLTFTPANWFITQTVTVTGVADTLFDGDIPYTITLAPAISSDSAYSGLNPADVSVVNRDKAVLQTKFYVVDDATQNKTFEYNASGGSVESYNLNAGNSAPRGAASTAAGDKVWVVDSNRNVYVYNRSGSLLGSWTAGSLANNATVEGIAVSPNGADVWIVDARSDKVYFYAGAATRLSGTQTATSSFSLNASNTSPKDIVTDGSSLWVVNDSTTDRVFKYNLAGTLLGNWTIDPANSKPTGITLDPTNVGHLWIVDSGTDRIYQYGGATARTTGSQTAALWYGLASGNGNPQGIADPPAGPGIPLTLSVFDGAPGSHAIDSLFTLLAANYDLSGCDDAPAMRGLSSRKTFRQRLRQA